MSLYSVPGESRRSGSASRPLSRPDRPVRQARTTGSAERVPGRPRQAQANALLWTAQVCLAMAFLGSGYAKLTEPMHLLVVLLEWPQNADWRFVRLMGLVEIVLAAGILVPLVSWAWGRGPLRASAVAVVVLALVMAVIHALDRAAGLAIYNIALLGLALVVLRFR